MLQVAHFTDLPGQGDRGVGHLEHWSDLNMGIQANPYDGKVDFVQTITLTTAVHVSVTGTLT